MVYISNQNMNAKFYKVGGYVRDKILGIESNDIDFSVEVESYEAMRAEIVKRGGDIFLEKPEFFTIRAKVPELGIADFVLCRKESHYTDGRHPDKVEIGTLHDDLARRDFTMNAIAEDEDGNIIDPFQGKEDIRARRIKCVGNTVDRFNEDGLRVLRAIRFAITKNFHMSASIDNFIRNMPCGEILKSVSEERIREELHKCFKHNTLYTLEYLRAYCELSDWIFRHSNVWLMPTTKER